MESPGSVGDYDYIVPARALRGSTDEMLADIDDAVEGLLALRQLIARRKTSNADGTAHRTRPQAAARPRLAGVPSRA